DLEKAKDLLQKALAIREKTFGKDHRQTKEVEHAIYAIEHPQETQEQGEWQAEEEEAKKFIAKQAAVSRAAPTAAPTATGTTSAIVIGEDVQSIVLDCGSW